MAKIDVRSLQGPILPNVPLKSPTQETQQGAGSFSDLLTKNLESDISTLKFSAHAEARLESRNIKLSQEQMQRLENATQLVAEKGARDALVMMDNLGFIVNVPNRTVITAVDSESMQDKVFTNIDSAIIANN